MPRVCYHWDLLETVETEEALAEFKQLEFCCNRVGHTDPSRRCQVCEWSEHEMIERRLRCSSKTCKQYGSCKYAWKLWGCEATGRWHILHNGMDHIRDKAVECEGPHRAVISAEMKKFILQQDECAIPPQLIYSHLRQSPDILPTSRGYPTLEQVRNCAKYLRRLQGTKNSREAVRRLVRQHAYDPAGDMSQAFIFGNSEDTDGFPYVGKGTDVDSFCIGITSVALVNACLEYSSEGRFTLFHADATFKLSDLGYPIITCGFSDASRTYQLASIFVVSRRTAQEYAMCLSALVRVFRRVRPTCNISVNAVMGDAEDAQVNGFKQVAEFASATYLMCFFHVLYNVRKRTKHLLPAHRRIVMDGIVRMHHTENMSSYYTMKDEVLEEWRSVPELETFTSYFLAQWVESRYWRWQIFHSPSGYATTNNPCETFNALLKKYTGRRRYHMQRLVAVAQVVVQDAPANQPTRPNQVMVPNRVTAKAATALISTGRVEAFATDDAALCRVRQMRTTEATDLKQIENLCEAVDTPFLVSENQSTEPSGTEILGPALLVREQRSRAAQLYKNVVSWSLRYAHLEGMPEAGWIVDVDNCVCGCKYYKKFKMCCHIIVGRKAKKLGKPGGDDKTEKLFNRTVRKAKSTTARSKRPKRSEGNTTNATLSLSTTLEGRPPLASRALDVQFILCPET